MPNYYYLGTSLPDLRIGLPPEISFDELKELLKNNLTASDYKQTRVIRSLYDILNIRALLSGDQLDPHGNYSENELEEALIGRLGLPDYVYDFLDRYESQADRLRHFSGLIAKFFNVESHAFKGFLHQYLTFERGWRLVFTALRAKKLGRDIVVELQYEDPEDDLTAQIIAQKDAKSYEPPNGYQNLKAIFEEYCNKPFELELAICEYRFDYIEQLAGLDVFSIRRILAYVAQFIIVEKWFALDKKKGTEIIDAIVKDLS